MYQLVAANAGHSPEVLMKHYNDTLETERRTLATLIETSFYPPQKKEEDAGAVSVDAILEAMQNNPALSEQILKKLLL